MSSSPPFSSTTFAGFLPRAVDRRLQDLGHRRADLDVVEAHVRGSARAAGVEAVVLDHVDAGFLRRVDDRAARARVDAREHDHACVGRDRLLGLRLLRRRVTLGVHDGVLDAGVVERLVEVGAVVALPARRARAVRQENPNAPCRTHRRRLTCRLPRLPCSCRRRRRTRPRPRPVRARMQGGRIGVASVPCPLSFQTAVPSLGPPHSSVRAD